MGGGGTISDSILGGTRHFFLLNLYNFKNIGGGGAGASPPYSAVPVVTSSLFRFCFIKIVSVPNCFVACLSI